MQRVNGLEIGAEVEVGVEVEVEVGVGAEIERDLIEGGQGTKGHQCIKCCNDGY